MTHFENSSNCAREIPSFVQPESILPSLGSYKQVIEQASSQVPQGLGKFEQFFGTVGGAA